MKKDGRGREKELKLHFKDGRLEHIEVLFNEMHPELLVNYGHNTPQMKERMRDLKENPLCMPEFYHTHNCYLMILSPDGDNCEVVEGEVIDQGKKDILLLSPNTRHYNFTSDSDHETLFLNINPAMVADLILPMMGENLLFSDFFMQFFRNPSTKHFLVFRDCIDDDLRQLFHAFLREYEKELPLYRSSLRLMFSMLLIELARRQEGKRLLQDNALALQLVQYISDHVRQISLSDVAEVFGYHPNHISRVIRQFTGKSFSQLKTDYRLAKACAYLENEKMTIEEIADASGFSDKTSFYRAYKKKFGTTPRKSVGGTD